MNDTDETEVRYSFHFYYVERRDDTSRPKVFETRWPLTIEDAGERVKRGEWLVAVPSPHKVYALDPARGNRTVVVSDAIQLIERLIAEGKDYGVVPTPDVR